MNTNEQALKQGFSQETPQQNSVPQTPKRPMNFIMIVFIFIVSFAAGAGVVWLYTQDSEDSQNQETEVTESSDTDESDQQTTDDRETITQNWEIYENEEYGFSFKYPANEWELEERFDCEEYTENCGSLILTKDNYVWELAADPIYTGAGYGFLFDMIVPPSEMEERSVSPAGYDSVMRVAYHSMSDFDVYDDPEIFPYDFADNSWGWAVLFDESGDSPGFGPVTGATDNDVKGDYFSIIYKYDIQEEDYSDLPVKGDEELEAVLTTMDLITNTVELETVEE